MRIDQFLAHSGYGSRKDVKLLLKAKLVSVNDKTVTKANKHIDPNNDIITVEGIEVLYEKYVYLMLNKPDGYLSATRDVSAPTILDLVEPAYWHYDLSPVGRLDKDTEGLILLTNDGKLNHFLTSPKQEIYKTYYAKIDGLVEENHKDMFLKGVSLDDGYVTKKAFLNIIKSDTFSEIELSICEGKFHQVKRMFEAIDMEVVYLKRLSIGPLMLDNSLELGEMRELTDEEIEDLLKYKK